jgi:hypothetical protein
MTLLTGSLVNHPVMRWPFKTNRGFVSLWTKLWCRWMPRLAMHMSLQYSRQ